MLLLARTTPYDELTDKTRGLIGVPGRPARGRGKRDRVRPLDMMINHAHHRAVHHRPRSAGREPDRRGGQGFRYIIDGWNAERILIASESIGDGRWFVERAAQLRQPSGWSSASPIGANQGVQFPIAQAYAHVEAADLVRYKAAWLFDARQEVRRRGQHGQAARLSRPPGRPPTPA